jgi:hypothetical protein
MAIERTRLQNAKVSFSIVSMVGICIVGVVLFPEREPEISSQKAAKNSFDSDEIIAVSVSDRAENQSLPKLINNTIAEPAEPAIQNKGLEDENLLREFFSMVDSLSIDLKSDLNDYIFSSDVIDYYEKNFAEIFKEKPLARNVVIENSSLMLLEDFWGEALSKTGLTDRETKDLRSAIHRLYIQNAEYSDLRNSGEITFEEWLERYAGSDEILETVSRFVSEDKFRKLSNYYAERIRKLEPSSSRAAIERDRVSFPAFDAIYDGNHILLESLLAAGADVNAISEHSPEISLLERAVDSEIPEMIEVMLAYGADIDSKDSYGNSMLHRAADNGNVEIVNLLLQAGANPLARDSFGFTPAMQVRLSRLELGEENYNELQTLLKNAEKNLTN